MTTIDDAPDRAGFRSTDDTTAAAPHSHSTSYSNLAQEHVQELVASAIPAAIAADQRVYSAHVPDDLPTWARWIYDVHGNDVLPCLVYPMVHPDGYARC